MPILSDIEAIKTELADHPRLFVDEAGQLYVMLQQFSPIGRNRQGYVNLHNASAVTGLMPESPLKQLTNKTNLSGDEIVLLDFSYAIGVLCSYIPDLESKVAPSMSKLAKYITWADLARDWRELWG
jgi:hypothetical protein